MTNTVNKLETIEITVDPAIQQRANMNEEAVKDYSDAIKSDKQLPPPKVFYDGQVYWLTDGFHRLKAYCNCDIAEIECEIIQGSKRDAILYAVGANSTHGLRRTNADKRKSVTTLLHDEEWGKNSSNWIAEKCAVSHTFVDHVRKERDNSTCNGCKSNTRIDKNGRELNTENIGKKSDKKSNSKDNVSESRQEKSSLGFDSLLDEKDNNPEEISSEINNIDATKQAFSGLLQESGDNLEKITDENDILKLIKSHSDKCGALLNNTDKTTTDLPSGNTDIDMSKLW